MHCTLGRAHGPCPTKCSAVERDPCVPPHTAPPVKLPVIARPVRKLVVAIRFPVLKSTFRCTQKGSRLSARPPQRVKKPRRVCRPQAAKKLNHFLSRHVRERKYSSGCQCGICPSQTDKLCAQQTASLLSEKPGGFFDSRRTAAFRSSPRILYIPSPSHASGGCAPVTEKITHSAMLVA